MKAFNNVLQLIDLVNQNFEHIQQLETLIDMLKLMQESNYSKEYPSEYNLTQEQIDELLVIAKTTYNSHYKFSTLKDPKFQEPINCVHNTMALIGVRRMPSFKEKYYKVVV